MSRDDRRDVLTCEHWPDMPDGWAQNVAPPNHGAALGPSQGKQITGGSDHMHRQVFGLLDPHHHG